MGGSGGIPSENFQISIPVCERGVIVQWKVYEGVTPSVKNGIKKEGVGPRIGASLYKTLLTTLLGLFCCTFVSLVSFLSFLKGKILISTLPVIPS